MRLATGWSGPQADERPDLVVEAHMVAPGQTRVFALAGVSVVNLGTREAGLFLTAAGNVIAAVPIAPAPKTRRRVSGQSKPGRFTQLSLF
ncbi:hypothetical protein OWR29_42370 [Actinoplanes sp. Pm04-4]|uniref:Uncharacterized protein n=1 Tax=Paractinoplanes pyxinae TaxID=2997416 RepID=A0ABT4BDU0_9ACTN|nr:hypothetical protein [Actinoplanes pyxinae]MCY1144686.1 hypothetical protein [Actinoplanes pyxinae]